MQDFARNFRSTLDLVSHSIFRYKEFRVYFPGFMFRVYEDCTKGGESIQNSACLFLSGCSTRMALFSAGSPSFFNEHFVRLVLGLNGNPPQRSLLEIEAALKSTSTVKTEGDSIDPKTIYSIPMLQQILLNQYNPPPTLAVSPTVNRDPPSVVCVRRNTCLDDFEDCSLQSCTKSEWCRIIGNMFSQFQEHLLLSLDLSNLHFLSRLETEIYALSQILKYACPLHR